MDARRVVDTVIGAVIGTGEASVVIVLVGVGYMQPESAMISELGSRYV